MGCATSKIDDLPAVALCRERCAFLDHAVRQRFAFSEAHATYLLSLRSLGLSLHRFFDHDDGEDDGGRSSSPTPLNLPPQRKGDPPEHHLSPHSDSESDDGASNPDPFLRHPDAQREQTYAFDYGNLGFNLPGGAGFMNMNYMKNQATPSVVYTQRPMDTETALYMGDEFSASSSSYNHYPNYVDTHNQNQNPNDRQNNSYSGNGNFGAGIAGRSSRPARDTAGFSSPPAAPSSSKAPPPPPSPPRNSAWDFLNPFDTVESFYAPHIPSHDSRSIREAEGIPDLEDEDNEVVKEIHGDQKLVGGGSSTHSKAAALEGGRAAKSMAARTSVEMESNQVEYQVHKAYKNNTVDADQERLKDGTNTSRSEFKGDLEVVGEILVQFQRASDSGSELAKFLEVGKLPYNEKRGSNQGSSTIWHLPVASSLLSMSKTSDIADPYTIDVDEIAAQRSKNHSSTLHKLYLWEKKLYEEVKVEEKMRVLHDGKSRKLKHLDQRGAEAQKVNDTRNLVRSLSTKIKIAIQVADKISMKINSMRDDELWPQLHELIQGLTQMWKLMLECHRNQRQAVREAKRLDATALRKHLSDAHFEATCQLEHDLINWTLGFCCWVGAQKGYVQALNNWLMKGLLYVPEETPDGVAPFSPGRVGGTPVFIICNHWLKSFDKISEKEVISSMRDLASNVLWLWDRDKVEMRQRMLANKDEKKIRSLEKEDLKIQKEIQALDKRMVVISAGNDGVPVAGHAVYQRETSEGGSLQASLQHVLEAMENFAASSLKVYEELLQRIEEEDLAR